VAAYEGKTVKQWLMDLARARLTEMEKRGILPKGKGVTVISIAVFLFWA
jgi:hypothetical protein